MSQVTSSLRALQKALVASPRQKAQNLRKSQRRLSRVNDGIQKAIDTHQIDTALGNQLLDLVAKAARALQAIGTVMMVRRVTRRGRRASARRPASPSMRGFR